MKTKIPSFALGFLLALLLFAGSHSPIQPTVEAQNAAAKSNFISSVRQWCRDYIDVDNRGQALKATYDALDYGNTLADPDFTGDNANYTKAQLVSAVSSLGSLHTNYLTGHNTNLQRLK